MKIANMYNHLNGYEYMLVHKKQLWEEIESAINSINADDFIKYSKDKAKLGKTLYDQKNINKQFRSILYPLNWKSVTIPYYVTGDIDTAKNVVGEYGYTFKKSDVNDLKNKLCEILGKPKADKAEQIEYVKNNYSWDEITDRTLELYKK